MKQPKGWRLHGLSHLFCPMPPILRKLSEGLWNRKWSKMSKATWLVWKAYYRKKMISLLNQQSTNENKSYSELRNNDISSWHGKSRSSVQTVFTCLPHPGVAVSYIQNGKSLSISGFWGPDLGKFKKNKQKGETLEFDSQHWNTSHVWP